MWELCGVFHVWAPALDHHWALVYLLAGGCASSSAYPYPALCPLASFQFFNGLLLTFEMMSLEVFCLHA